MMEPEQKNNQIVYHIYFDPRVSSVSVFNRALTPSEISALYEHRVIIAAAWWVRLLIWLRGKRGAR